MFPVLIKLDEAQSSVSSIADVLMRDSTTALLSATEQFFQEQPSQLTVSFDMAFLAEIFQGRFREIRAMWRGEYQSPFGEWPDDNAPAPATAPATIPVPDPREDISEFGVRDRQALNYVAVHRCERTRDVLLVLSFAVQTRQNPRLRSIGKSPRPPVIRPEFSIDCLFLVMATDYALRPGQELARLLSVEPTGATA